MQNVLKIKNFTIFETFPRKIRNSLKKKKKNFELKKKKLQRKKKETLVKIFKLKRLAYANCEK